MDVGHGRIAPICFLVTVLAQLGLTYFVLRPEIGFDDANITQVYARHIAEGHGYVYNIGGERVEGSTSLLWTYVNAALFLTPYPIALITALSGLLMAGTLALSGAITRAIGGSDITVATTYLLFNFFPGFFVWMTWALMDITLWVFAITASVWALVRLFARPNDRLGTVVFLLAAIALPLIRPEGIAVVLSLALFVLFLPGFFAETRWKVLSFGGLGLLSIGAATLWRLSYFGYPVPNTFYAKTSTDLIGQIGQGVYYMTNFLNEPTTVVLLVCTAFGVLAVRSEYDRPAARIYGVFVPYFAVGGALVYTVLGGDHFGSYRFMIYLYPLALPLGALAISRFLDTFGDRIGQTICMVIFACYGALTWLNFAEDGGRVGHELRLAEDFRDVGSKLAEIPGDPSLAVIAAGGIKMGYPGTVYDVLGLNWIEMAQAGETNTEVAKNHGGFNAKVFWEASPDIVFPRLGRCDDGRGRVGSTFFDKLTQRLAHTEEFTTTYVALCDETVVFYAKRSLEADLTAQGFARYLN